MADAKSNEATLEALDGARSIINSALNTVRSWQSESSGADFTAGGKSKRLALVTAMDSDAVATFLATAKAWDGTVSSASL